jgi:hypothetical protein
MNLTAKFHIRTYICLLVGPPPASDAPAPPNDLTSSLGGLPWYMWVIAIAGLLLVIATILILAAKHRLDPCWRCITSGPIWSGVKLARHILLPALRWLGSCNAKRNQLKQVRQLSASLQCIYGPHSNRQPKLIISWIKVSSTISILL